MAAFDQCAPEIAPKVARKVAFAVAKAGSISYRRYMKLCGDRKTADFLQQQNIFVQGNPGRIRFENRILESDFQEEVARQEEIARQNEIVRQEEIARGWWRRMW